MNNARLPRILGAIFYDTLIVFSVIFVAALWIPMLPEEYQTMPAMLIFKQLYMLSIAFAYFGYSWRHGGQTIGMKAWRIRIQNSHGASTISWQQCLLRFAVSVFSWVFAGLGFLWVLFSSQHRSWHDLASDTQLIVVPKDQAN